MRTMDKAPAGVEMAKADTSAALAELLDGARVIAGGAARADLVDRLNSAKIKVLDPRLRVVVVGSLKQGKSQLINSILNLQVCSVGDDETTALPTLVQNAPEPSAELVTAGPGGEPVRLPLPIGELHSVSPNTPYAQGREVLRLEVNVPSPVLAEGVIFVDTPGIGGHGNPHAASTLGLLPSADAVLVVSDASQEFTEPELAFVRQAISLCPVAACIVTKTDLYPHWREIVAADQSHLQRNNLTLPIIPTSSLLRNHALTMRDEGLNVESGFPELFRFLREGVMASADSNTKRSVGLDVNSVAEHLILGFSTELAALRDPGKSAETAAVLKNAKAKAEDLHKHSSLWQQTLNDGITDLAADIDHDLRDRLRRVTREAEETIDSGDPGKDWDQLGEWLQQQAATSIGDNFVWAHERSVWLAEVVAQHFTAMQDVDLPSLDMADLDSCLDPVHGLGDLESGQIGITQKVLVGMRGSYGGVLMFGLLTTFMGMALLNPISLGAGVLLGTKAYREDREVRLARRRNEAKTETRRFMDEVSFQVGKESKDRLRLVQRLLRDHFTGIAGQTLRSLNDSLRAGQDAAKLASSEREKRAVEIERQLRQLAELKRRAAVLISTGSA